MSNFWLVQRLENNPEGIFGNPFVGGSQVEERLNAGVRLSYMGSSEFEVGAVPKSANRIAHAANNLKVVTRNVITPNFEEPAYFVCTAEQEANLLPQWDEWAQNPRSIERPYYFEPRTHWAYTDEDGPRYVGWWALSEDLIWTREEERAETIRNAFLGVAPNPAKQV